MASAPQADRSECGHGIDPLGQALASESSCHRGRRRSTRAGVDRGPARRQGRLRARHLRGPAIVLGRLVDPARGGARARGRRRWRGGGASPVLPSV